MNSYADILFARGSFLSGISRVLDIGGTQVEFNRSKDSAQADHAALLMDMRAVGDEMRSVMETFRREQGLDSLESED